MTSPNDLHPAASKLRLGVSACLLGELVRYDGGHRRNRFIVDTLAVEFVLVPVCPELEAGLGVPREPIQLIGSPGQECVIGRESGIDRTDQLQAFIEGWMLGEQAARLSGFILKSKSPSCGGDRVKLFNSSGAFEREGVGLFARALNENFPELPTIDEIKVDDPTAREDFLSRVKDYHSRRR